jgi:hypothetical protein
MSNISRQEKDTTLRPLIVIAIEIYQGNDVIGYGIGHQEKRDNTGWKQIGLVVESNGEELCGTLKTGEAEEKAIKKSRIPITISTTNPDLGILSKLKNRTTAKRPTMMSPTPAGQAMDPGIFPRNISTIKNAPISRKICNPTIGFWFKPLNQSLFSHTMSGGTIHIKPISAPPAGPSLPVTSNMLSVSIIVASTAVIHAI